MEMLYLFQTMTRLDDLLNTLIGISIKLLFILLVIKGVHWAKLVVSILLVLNSFGYLILAGYEQAPILYVYGAFYMLFGTIIHWIHFEKISTSGVDKITTSYPRLIRRVKAMLIDGMLILFTLVLIMILVGERASRPTVMITSTILLVLFYEPVLTSYAQTIGQRLMKIKVIAFDQPNKRIHIGKAYVRWIAKGLLGWLSFITINFDKDRRAIHDLASDSIMVEV